MKLRQILLATCYLLPATCFLSCTIEHIDNGYLDGFWHMERVDTIGGGALDLSDETLFWAFQARLMHTQGADESCYFRFKHSGDTLIISEPYLDHRHEDDENGGDIQVTDTQYISPYGINNLVDTFKVEKLNNNDMILTTKALRLWFKKF